MRWKASVRWMVTGVHRIHVTALLYDGDDIVRFRNEYIKCPRYHFILCFVTSFYRHFCRSFWSGNILSLWKGWGRVCRRWLHAGFDLLPFCVFKCLVLGGSNLFSSHWNTFKEYRVTMALCDDGATVKWVMGSRNSIRMHFRSFHCSLIGCLFGPLWDRMGKGSSHCQLISIIISMRGIYKPLHGPPQC